MDEITRLHSLNIEWGCLTNLMDKISDAVDSIDGGWPELIDMVVDAVDEEANTDPEELFKNLYQYLFRLYYRLKMNPTVREFNQVSKIKVLEKEVYRVTNYNYQTFKWAKAHGFADRVSNDYIDVYVDKLDDKTKRAYEKKLR